MAASLTFCVCVCVCIPLHAVCPPGSRLGPSSCHPHVAGPHGDVASGCHHNLEASSERSRGANDGLETVTGTQTHCNTEKGLKGPGLCTSCVYLGSVLHTVAQMDRLLLLRKKIKYLDCLNLS